jgi:hypothetical protein
MISILSNQNTYMPFVLELVTITEIGKLLSQICYDLEGDGPLIFRTYELVRKVHFILNDTTQLPQTVIDLCRSMATGHDGLDPIRFTEYETYCRNIIAPARTYFASQMVKTTVSDSVKIAKVAAMWDPLKARHMSLDATMTVELVAQRNGGGLIIPWINDEVRRSLNQEVPTYKAIVEPLDDENMVRT